MTINEYVGIKGELMTKVKEVKSKIQSLKGYALIS